MRLVLTEGRVFNTRHLEAGAVVGTMECREGVTPDKLLLAIQRGLVRVDVVERELAGAGPGEGRRKGKRA